MRQSFDLNKLIRFLWIVLFLLLCLIPSLGMLFFGETQSAANEILARRPVIHNRDGSFNREVLNDSSDYLADRFAFRKDLVTLWSRLNSLLFHSSVEEQVILGHNDWLYYQATVDDYMGRSMSDEELEQAAAYLLALQNEAESRGARFFFTIAPNKNSLYADNMPAYIPADHASSNAERLKPVLDRIGVHYIDLFEIFSAQEETLYYQGDSHWTDRGAALAGDTILASMGKSTAYYAGPFTTGAAHIGDLYEMLYPSCSHGEVSELYAPGFTYSLSSDPDGGNALKIRSENSEQDGILLCWRDSFGISLYPYLANSFQSAVFLRSSNYDLNEIDSIGADTVLIELVERNLAQLTLAGN